MPEVVSNIVGFVIIAVICTVVIANLIAWLKRLEANSDESRRRSAEASESRRYRIQRSEWRAEQKAKAEKEDQENREHQEIWEAVQQATQDRPLHQTKIWRDLTDDEKKKAEEWGSKLGYSLADLAVAPLRFAVTKETVIACQWVKGRARKCVVCKRLRPCNSGKVCVECWQLNQVLTKPVKLGPRGSKKMRFIMGNDDE